jgi:hypothetical protein
MPLYGRWTSKPPQGTPIDRSHGLATGLVWFAPCWGYGPVQDVVGNNNMALTGATWGQASTTGLLCSTTSFAASISPPPQQLMLPYPFTVVMGWRLLTTGSYVLAGFSTAGGTCWQVRGNGTDWIVRYSNGATLTQSWTSSVAQPAAGTDNVVAVSWSTSQIAIYQAGLQVGTDSVSVASPTYPGASPTFYFANGGTEPYILYWAGLWGRLLSAAEHAEIARNPWQIFQPPPAYWLYRRAAVNPLFRRTLYGRAGRRGVQ